MPAYSHLIDSNGDTLNLHQVCPNEVMKRAKEALMRRDAANSDLAKKIGGPPDFEPLRQFLRTRAARRSPAAASLRSLGEGGWWTQERLFGEGLEGISHPFCVACGPDAEASLRAPGGPNKGTLIHRCVGCPATHQVRCSTRHGGIIAKAQSALHDSEPLFVHGVPYLRPRTPAPPFIERWCGGQAVEDFTFSGDVFADGALSGGGPKDAWRAGWAAVIVSPCGLTYAGRYGTCPDAWPSSQRAQLRALLEVLRRAAPPLRIWTDCAGILSGLKRGKKWCCCSSRAAADIWQAIWHILDDLGLDQVTVVKEKGHATEADVQSGRIAAWEKTGNEHADHFARYGSALAEHCVPSKLARNAYREAINWYKWLLVLAANWPNDVQQRVHGSPGLSRAPSVPPAFPQQHRSTVELCSLALHNESPHCLEVSNGSVRCSICNRQVTAGGTGSLAKIFAASPCRGDVATRAVDANDTPQRSQAGQGLHLYQTGALTWCRRCGAYSAERLNGLGRQCVGPSSARASQLARLQAGRHPLSNEVLGATRRLV